MEAVTADKLHRLVRQLLEARGLKDPEAIGRFLNPSYDNHLHDPLLLRDMGKAVKRILQAAQKGEKVAVYGDYDIDGIAATALMLETLEAQGLTPQAYIPDRFEEGYGLNTAALKKLKKEGFDLIISVDCGITSVKEAAWAKANGLDLIITDHHEPKEQIPQAIAVINPKRPGDKYPFKELSGAGVAFKLAQALQQATGKPDPGHEKWLLDLAALGTICDHVALVDENRVIAKYGLIVAGKTKRQGLKALADTARIELNQLNTYHIGFIIGPRLNASGRLKHAAGSLELMRADAKQAHKLAAELEDLNRQRQQDQLQIERQAESQAHGYPDDPVLVLSNSNWSHGIVGIVASRIVERFRKPTIILQEMGATAKGSARSTGNFNLAEALETTGKHLQKYGGHRFAAGLTIKTAKIPAFREAINQAYKELAGKELSPHREPDLVIDDFSDLGWDLFRDLEKLEPFGHGNPQPLFLARPLKIVSLKGVGKDAKHLKLSLSDRQGKLMEGIGFGLTDQHGNLKPGQEVEAAFQVAKNEYNGRVSLQLIVAYLK